jgi:hypothetical protein
MRRGKYLGLLAMLLFAFVVMLAPTTASSQDATGVGTDEYGNRWEVTSTAGGECEYYDNKGNAYPGIEFKYQAKHLDDFEGSVIQSNVDFPICDPAITKTAPSNNQVKIRDCDPNAPFRCDDPNKDVITFDSITYDAANDEYEFKVCIEKASIQKATIQLKTQLGNVLVPGDATENNVVLGPGCCSNVARITEATLSLGTTDGWMFDPEDSKGSVFLSFDVCSGDMNAKPRDVDANYYEYTQIPGGFLCLGDVTSYNSRTCDLINQYGPEPLGALFITTKNIYVGYGSSTWRGPAVDTYPDLLETYLECTPADAYSPTVLTYGDATIDLDWCGNLINPETEYLWFCEADARMHRDDSTCGLVLTGTGTFRGTCYIYKNGAWRRYPDSYCQ